MANRNGGSGSSGGNGSNGDQSTIHIPQSSMANDAGRVLNGRYALIAPVGSGGMATVYKARDNILGRIVAIKVLREQYTTDDQFVARFRREAQAAANLTHPNIVNVYDVGQDGDIQYIVMEFIAGQSVKELIAHAHHAPLPMSQAVSIAAQILAGLEYAHRSGLIHRDIKPQNVLITPDGEVKVTDFGIAKSVSDLGLTEAGTALGTAHYFSPEQAKGERVVPQSDIYAVGVTLYEMLTGRLPFESENAVGLAYKHISETPVSPRQINPNIPMKLEAIVMKALAKEPSQRFANAADMERALRSIQLVGQAATMEVPVPFARPTVTGAGGDSGTRTANLRGGRQGAASNQATGSFRRSATTTGQLKVGGSGAPRMYPASAGASAGAATRHVASPLGSPTSMAMRPTPVRVQAGGMGCSPAAIAFFVLGLLAIVAGVGVYFAPQWTGFFTEAVVPTPTPTPIIPTATPVPPTFTSTSTPTSTPTNTATATPTPGSVAVPQLVGLGIQDATVLARQKGFVVLELDRIETVEYPAGVVAQQNPLPNSIYQQTRTIQVRVSRGPPSFKLPNLANTDADQARTVLEGAGLSVQVVSEGSDTIPKGVVIRTIPQGDSSVKPGSTVKLVVSRGEVATVPNLAGISDVDLARQRLEAANLELGNITEADDPNDSVPPGAVLSQNPAPGAVVEKYSPVDIVVRKKQ